MVFASALLVSGLAVAVTAPIASSTATVDASYLWGTWELTGIGQPNNRATVTAHRMTFVFDSAGWREIFWEDAGMTRHVNDRRTLRENRRLFTHPWNLFLFQCILAIHGAELFAVPLATELRCPSIVPTA